LNVADSRKTCTFLAATFNLHSFYHTADNVSTKEQMTTSFSWNTLTVVLQVVIQLAYTGLLARLVAKDSFMLMGIVLGIMGFAEIFSQVGVGPALIQRKEVNQQHINGAFYVAVILGLGFTLLFLGLAPAIALFYELPELTAITQVVCTSFLISAIAVVPRSMMMKHMRFKTMFKASMISIVGGNLVVGLTLAYLQWDVWAYVWALFAQNLLMTLALWYFEPVRITLQWDLKYTRELIRYGAGSTLFNALNYLATKLDVLLIPRALRAGQAELSGAQRNMASYFERASYAMTQPITIMGKLSDSVLFSGMSRMQDDKERLQKTITLATSMLGIVLIPSSVFMIFFADELITLWLGMDYLETAAILKVLFLAVVFRSMSKLGDSLLRAKDAVFQGSLFKAIYVLLMAFGIWFGTSYSMTGAATGIVLATVVHYAMNMFMTSRLIQLNWGVILNAWLPGIFLGAICAATGWSLHILTFWFQVPGVATLATAVIVLPGTCILGIFAFPRMLGRGSNNPLTYLPQRLKLFKPLGSLVARIQ
jgi:O-antigen/teichoic acid export membrane protein